MVTNPLSGQCCLQRVTDVMRMNAALPQRRTCVLFCVDTRKPNNCLLVLRETEGNKSRESEYSDEKCFCQFDVLIATHFTESRCHRMQFLLATHLRINFLVMQSCSALKASTAKLVCCCDHLRPASQYKKIRKVQLIRLDSSLTFSLVPLILRDNWGQHWDSPVPTLDSEPNKLI
jgi:hypothetical protein